MRDLVIISCLLGYLGIMSIGMLAVGELTASAGFAIAFVTVLTID